MTASANSLPLGAKPPEMTILSDHPSQSADKDLLNLDCTLSVVLDILRHNRTQTPMTIAIYGDWGTGKTSAMHWLESQLNTWNKLIPSKRASLNEKEMIHPRVYPVWFDPWKYHSREDVWRGIISEVILALITVGNLDRQNCIPRMKDAARQFGAFLGRSFLHALAQTELKVKGDAAVVGSELTIKGEMFRDIYDEYDKASHPEKGFLNQFEHSLETWVKNCLQEGDRIALFIDDLDRCLPDVTLEVLEAIKLYLNIPQLMFVVGLDREAVDSVVTEHYKERGMTGEKPRQYLNKIFQVHIEIPPSEQQMVDFQNSQIRQLDQVTSGYWKRSLREHQSIAEEGIRVLSRHNPRETKRLLNSALLRGRAAADNSKLLKESTKELLFAQGVQFFLIQRTFTDRKPENRNLLLKGEYLRWFAQWSVLVKNDPSYRPPKKSDKSHAEGEPATKSVKSGKPSMQHSQLIAHEFLALEQADLFYEDGSAFDKAVLFKEELLWKLLQIPFSIEVAQSAPQPPPQTRHATLDEEPPLESDLLPEISKLLRSRIGQALGKPSNRLTDIDLSTIQNLNLSDTKVTDSELRYLERLTALESLDASGTLLANLGLTYLGKLVALRSLDLSRTPITNEGLESLNGLPALLSLKLEKTKITDAGLAHLEKLRTLTSLDLSYTETTDVGLSHLKKLTNLRSLILWGTKITGAGLEQLKGLKSLQSLDLRFTGLTSADFAHLEKLLTLQQIQIDNVTIGDKEVLHLKQLALLEATIWHSQITDAGFRCIDKLSTLKMLSLWGTNVNDYGLQYIGNLKSLEFLDLSDTKITDAGLPYLEKLSDLSFINLSGTQITDAGLRFLEPMSSLLSLDLQKTQVTEAGKVRLKQKIPQLIFD